MRTTLIHFTTAKLVRTLQCWRSQRNLDMQGRLVDDIDGPHPNNSKPQ